MLLLHSQKTDMLSSTNPTFTASSRVEKLLISKR